jgi:hypothetical protein
MNTRSNTGSSIATNVIAESVLESLKSGLLLKGTVRSHALDGSIATSWIGIDLPGIGERQVAVHADRHLKIGQEVMIQCVPNPLNPGRYKFQVADGPPSPEAGQ